MFNIHFNRIQCTLYILNTVRYLVCNIHTVTWLTLIIKMYTSVCTASTVTIFNLHFAQVMYNARLIHRNNSRYAYCIYAILSMYVYKVYNSYLSGCRADDPINKRLRPSSPRGGLVHLYTHSTLKINLVLFCKKLAKQIFCRQRLKGRYKDRWPIY